MTAELTFLQRLSLGADADERAIRRAYARELKLIDQEADPAGFQSLREAYETALYWVRHKEELEDEEEIGDYSAPPELDAPIGLDLAQPAPLQAPSPSPPQPVYEAANQAPANLRQEQIDIDHDAQAEAVFADFLQRATAIVHERPVTPDAPWRRELRASLDDPRLINIIARETFERRVADLLVSGWRPGHEALLVAAVNTFGWSGDRRRVFGLGRPGALLDAAIDERATFDLQPDAQRDDQRRLIERLRDPKPPGTRELVRNSATLETLIARFPTWLALITDVDNIVRWREQNDQLPPWRRKLTFTGLRKPAEHSYEHQKKGFINWGWVIVLGLVALIRFLAHDGGGSSSTPDEATRYLNRGTQQLNEGDAKSAIDSFTKVLALKPHEAEAYGNRAAAYLYNGDDQHATEDFDKFAEFNPNSPLLFRGRGMLSLRAGRDDEAISAFTKALALEPNSSYALTHRAEAYENANHPEKALADIDEALRVDGNPGPGPYILRMKIFAQQNNSAKAIAQIEPMLAANPASAIAYIKAANLQMQLHDREKALALLDRGVAAAVDADIYLYRAQLRPRPDKQGRQRDIHSGLELAPDSIYGHRLRAELELENGDSAAAIATLTKIVDNPNITASPMPALVQRGVIQLKTGKPSLAQADFERARATAKTAIDLNDVAWELARQNVALPTALSIAREAVVKQPGTVIFIDSEAFILLRLGRYKEATERYDAALAISPKLPAALFGRGIAKRRMGRSSAGDADLKAARAIFADIDSRFSQFGVVP